MAIDAKYGEITTEKKEIPITEPVFLIRAQDVLSGPTVRDYAILYLATTNDKLGFNRIIDVANQMDMWHFKKVPD
ncbi:hypothetical protein LCGC14_0517140 [marine sediment metagenome]|uniref:Uncharacterized protein n=1 Tax=marine sediment metagenome TaxID=412755 RepID=A0A0F9RZP9_9ZZZZ